MLPLVINPEELAELRLYAETHVISLEDVKSMTERRVGLPRDYSRVIPLAFNLNYAVEVQEAGLLRHMSCSIGIPGRQPSQFAVGMILPHLGYKGNMWVETGEVNGLFVVHIYEWVKDGEPLLEA